MEYCAENNCVPDIMIYHELAWWSIPDWQMHVDDYRRIEDGLGINDLPIVVTEYGDMQTCGNPGRMVHFVTNIEQSGAWAQMAFWRLANNLNDTAADDNSPNSNWWLFRKYAEMDGRLLETQVSSIKDSQLHDGDWVLSYKGLASINDSEDEIRIIAEELDGPAEAEEVKVDVDVESYNNESQPKPCNETGTEYFSGTNCKPYAPKQLSNTKIPIPTYLPAKIDCTCFLVVA